MLIFYEAPLEKERVKIDIEGLEVVNTLRRAAQLNLLNAFVVWQFIGKYLTGRIYCIYVVMQNGKCSHTSQVIGKGWRFPFMNKDDIEIGPCWTAHESRRQGIYTSIIQRILYDFTGRQGWMLCDENNIASIRGIEKAGLELMARGKRTKPLGCRMIGRFIITEKK